MHVRHDGVSASTLPLPSELPALTAMIRVLSDILGAGGQAQHARWEPHEGLNALEALRASGDAVLLDALDGRTASRCVVRTEAPRGARLGVRLDRGALTSVAIVDSGVTVVGCVACSGGPGKLVRLPGPREGALPTKDEALDALQRLEAGLPLSQAARGPAFEHVLR